MRTLPRFFAVCLLFALTTSADGGDPIRCDHSYFGIPNGHVSPEWNIPEASVLSLLKQAELAPPNSKLFFACSNTFAALTFSPDEGFRFVVLPCGWTDFSPKRISEPEMKKRVMNLTEIEALLDSPSVGMGVVNVRITAFCGEGDYGAPLPADESLPQKQDG